VRSDRLTDIWDSEVLKTRDQPSGIRSNIATASPGVEATTSERRRRLISWPGYYSIAAGAG
jgi:hypothetical protein